MVCSITRGPANPIKAFGSARIISPSMAKLAVTPPVVGSVSTLINNWPASWCFFKAAEVFAICIRDTIPSCIRAPPEQAKRITGSFSDVARSTIWVTFSPTICPILLIRNLASQTPKAVSWPPIFPFPVTIASFKFVRSLAAWTFLSYPGKFRGLVNSMFPFHSSKVPSSISISIRRNAWTRKYPPHLGQT